MENPLACKGGGATAYPKPEWRWCLHGDMLTGSHVDLEPPNFIVRFFQRVLVGITWERINEKS